MKGKFIMRIPFKVGDKVKVKTKTNDYSYTKYGSEGIVTMVEIDGDDSYCMIDFYKATGDLKRQALPHHYRFYLRELLHNFSLVDSPSLSEADKKYESIILKIQLMKQQRKDKGYAY